MKLPLTKDGDTEFEFYKKKAKQLIFIHHKSVLPKRTKFYIIRNERKRINQRCSTRHESRDKHNSDVDEILRLNGYPQHILETLQKEVSTYISYNSSQQQQQTISIFCE